MNGLIINKNQTTNSTKVTTLQCDKKSNKMQTETNTTEQQTKNLEQPANAMPALKMKTRSMARATRSSAATNASNPEEPTADATEKHPQTDATVPPFEAAAEELKSENEVAEEPICKPDDQPEKAQEEMPAKVEEEAQPIAHPVAEEAKVHSVNSSKRVSKKRDFAEFSSSELAEAIQQDSRPASKSLRLNDGTRIEVAADQQTPEPQPEKEEESEPRADPAAVATKEAETVSGEINPPVEAEETKEEAPVPDSDAPATEEVQQITEQVQSLNVEDAGAAEKSSGEE